MTAPVEPPSAPLSALPPPMEVLSENERARVAEQSMKCKAASQADEPVQDVVTTGASSAELAAETSRRECDANDHIESDDADPALALDFASYDPTSLDERHRTHPSAAIIQVLLLIACVGVAAPVSAQAQLASAPVGVVRVAPDASTASFAAGAFVRRPESAEGDRASHVVIGGLIGAMTGAAATALVVRHCEAHDDSRGEGPPCALGYVTIGPVAVLVGTMLGVIVADW